MRTSCVRGALCFYARIAERVRAEHPSLVDALGDEHRRECVPRPAWVHLGGLDYEGPQRAVQEPDDRVAGGEDRAHAARINTLLRCFAVKAGRSPTQPTASGRR